MINVSNACRAKIRANSKVIGIGNIDFADSVHLELSGADFMANTIGYSQASSSTSSFDIGAAIIGKMSFSLNNYNGKFNSYDFAGSTITSWIGVPLDSTTELIKKGVFNIQQPDSYGTTIALTAYDNMSKFQKPYSEVSTSYPTTLQMIVTDICLHCDVQLATPHFDNYTYSIPTRPDDKSMSCLDMIAYVAQIAGCFAMCDTNGRLVYKWYDMGALNSVSLDGGVFDSANPYATGDNADGGNFTDYSSGDNYDGGGFDDEYFTLYAYTGLKVVTDDVVITGIKAIANDDDSEHLYGNTGYVLELSGNPLITSANAASIAEYLGLKIIGMRFRPFSAQAQSDPTIEPGDICIIFDNKSNAYRAPVTSVNYNVGNRTSLACNAETPARNQATGFSQLSKTITQIKQSNKRELSNYDKQVKAMNQLANNAMGFYTTYEDMPDGSVITYMHDKPTVAESLIVWKETVDGFFLSQDGGETYIYGRDSSGNEIVNVLSAVGIICDWIKGGTLTLGGQSNISGSCVIYDADGNEIGRLDESGITTNSANITGGKIAIITDDRSQSQIILRYQDEDTGIDEYCQVATDGIALMKSNSGSDYKTSFLFPDHMMMNGFELYSGQGNDDHIKFGSYFGIDRFGKISIKNVLPSPYPSSSLSSSKLEIGTTYLEQGNFYLNSNASINSSGYAQFGSLKVWGTKERIATTDNYGVRSLYCYEMPKPYFGDIGEAILDDAGICYVQIDDIFYETVNTSCNYQVFLQKQGKGDLWIKERTPTHFVVEGTPNLSFAWEIKARQAGFEYERLDKFEKPNIGGEEDVINYENEAINYVTNFYKELGKI